MTGRGDPLHGVTLERMLVELSEELGWEAMGRQVPIRCFTHTPSVKSSLAFLRRTPWARARVEALYAARAARRGRAGGADSAGGSALGNVRQR